MTPALSLCGITRGKGMDEPSQPRRFLVSPGLTPETVTRTRTSPGPGTGSGSSPRCRTSAAGPWSSYQEASIGGTSVGSQPAGAAGGCESLSVEWLSERCGVENG